MAAVPILGGLELSIAKGKFVPLAGRLGCGKTTFLMCLTGLLAPSEGQVRCKGQLVTTLPIGLL